MRTLRTPALLLAGTLLAAACAVDAPTDPAARAPEGASFDGVGYLGNGGKSDTTTVSTTDGGGYIGSGTKSDSTVTASDGGGYIGTGG